jgi:hypothetical protein
MGACKAWSLDSKIRGFGMRPQPKLRKIDFYWFYITFDCRDCFSALEVGRQGFCAAM